MAGDASRSNGKKGGRPKGALNLATVDKALKLEVLREMVAAHLEPMVQAQVLHATGIRHTFMRDDNGKFTQLTDPKLIEAALNSGEEGKYYWTYSKDPSVQAFSDLLNRTFGKPPERVEMTGAEGGPLVVKWQQ